MAVDQNAIAWTERYRAVRHACDGRLGNELTDLVSRIGNPVTKLRFLRDVIDRHRRVPFSFKYAVLRPLNRALLRAHTWMGRTLVAMCAIAMVIAVNGFNTQAHTQVKNDDAIESRAAANRAIPSVPQSTSPDESAIPLPVAESLPIDTLGVTPTTIWLADHGANWELYSNGLRIETAYVVAGESRRYRVHDRERGLQAVVRTKPIGILFHTSESDVWPLETGFEKQLRQTSKALLNYVQSQRAYNYLIDRFGRVYRIVDDETRANHAGNAIWANGKEVYVDLNSAFLGVSFESRWEGGRTLPITRAQLIAGRNLTHYLRQRFAIAPEMCVTHGLTSVNPKQYLIGYHLDWARGFPFAAFGLPDQYALPPPSIALFGFSYNGDFVRAVGGGWPGAIAGELAFVQEAVDRGIGVEALRNERRSLYNKWTGEARAAQPESAIKNPTAAGTASGNSITEQRG